MKTPVAFIIFNRPESTERVFSAIARARPERLLVVADGPRNGEEQQLCAKARAVIEQVDWPCEVLTNFSDSNLGCKRRVSSGLNWVFEKCEEAIVVEDDCLPDDTFFPFCVELLEKYRADERVGMICGTNFQQGKRRSPDSYFFSLHTTAWGWASWRRVWRHYDVDMTLWPQLRETNWLADLLANPVAERHWRETFDSTFNGELDTWDYQFFFSWWAQNLLAITPSTNLVANIGFGSDASHTKEAVARIANLPVQGIAFPLKHPAEVNLNRAADDFSFRQLCPWIVENQSYYWQLRHKVAQAFPSPVRERIRLLRSRAQNRESS